MGIFTGLFSSRDKPTNQTVGNPHRFSFGGTTSDHPLYYLLHDEPNSEMSSFVLRETMMTHLLLWGNAYAQILRNGKNEIIGLYPLLPERMQVERSETGQLYYLYSSNKGQVKLEQSEVFHIPGLGFDGLVGYSSKLSY